MGTVLSILAGLVTIIVILLRWYTSKEEKEERSKNETHEAIAKNDFKRVSAKLNDMLGKLRSKNRRRSR